MESFTGELLLALTPEQRGRTPQRRFTPVWLCYQLRSGPRLWRCASPDKVRGGILMAQDSALSGQMGDAAPCCAQAVRECVARGAAGFWANWSRPPDKDMTRLTVQLEGALEQAGLTLYVNEPYGPCVPRARVFLSSALSGGTLEGRICAARKEYGRERVVLAVERMGEDFALPAPDGQGRHLGSKSAAEMACTRGLTVFRSEELCASYCTFQEGDSTHLLLFDTDGDVRETLCLAQRLGVERVLLALGELGGLR